MSRWYAHIRVEKNNQFTEYKGDVHTVSPDGTDVSPSQVRDGVMDTIISHSPHMKGAKVVHDEITRES